MLDLGAVANDAHDRFQPGLMNRQVRRLPSLNTSRIPVQHLYCDRRMVEGQDCRCRTTCDIVSTRLFQAATALSPLGKHTDVTCTDHADILDRVLSQIGFTESGLGQPQFQVVDIRGPKERAGNRSRGRR